MPTRNTIKLEEPLKVEEIKSAGALYPGDHVKFDGSGYIVAAVAADDPPSHMFLMEDRGSGGDIGDQYASGAQVPVMFLTGGQRVLATGIDSTTFTVNELVYGTAAGEITNAQASAEPAIGRVMTTVTTVTTLAAKRVEIRVFTTADVA